MISGEDVVTRRFVAEGGVEFCARHLQLRNRYRDGTVVAVVRASGRVGTGISREDRWEGCGFREGHRVVRRWGAFERERRVMGVLWVRGTVGAETCALGQSVSKRR
jgi:hypothetical protein